MKLCTKSNFQVWSKMFCVQFVQLSYTDIVCYSCLMWATFVLIPTYRQKLKTLKPTQKMTRLKLFGDARSAPIRTCLKSHVLTYRGTLTSWRPMSAGMRCARRQRLLRCMASIKEAVKKDKCRYKSKLEDQFASNNTRSVRQSQQHITYKARAITNSDPTFPNQLNTFYSRY